MHHHDIASLGAFFRNEPEEVMERAFQFFEQNPEIPALLLMMSDGDQTRGMVGDMSRESYWNEGPRRFDSMVESFVVLGAGTARTGRCPAAIRMAVQGPDRCSIRSRTRSATGAGACEEFEPQSSCFQTEPVFPSAVVA